MKIDRQIKSIASIFAKLKSSPGANSDVKVLLVLREMYPSPVAEATISFLVGTALGREFPRGTVGASLTTLCDWGWAGRQEEGYVYIPMSYGQKDD